LEQTSVEIASAVDRTANDAPQDEQRTSTTYSIGCWIKEFPPSIGRRPNRDARTCTNDPGVRAFPQPPEGARPWLALWASHRNKIEVGGCTDCVLAATTAAASSAILGHEHERKGVDRE
jgi:hypothetical protein